MNPRIEAALATLSEIEAATEGNRVANVVAIYCAQVSAESDIEQARLRLESEVRALQNLRDPYPAKEVMPNADATAGHNASAGAASAENTQPEKIATWSENVEDGFTLRVCGIWIGESSTQIAASHLCAAINAAYRKMRSGK
jgi:hypothetical protein